MVVHYLEDSYLERLAEKHKEEFFRVARFKRSLSGKKGILVYGRDLNMKFKFQEILQRKISSINPYFVGVGEGSFNPNEEDYYLINLNREYLGNGFK